MKTGGRPCDGDLFGNDRRANDLLRAGACGSPESLRAGAGSSPEGRLEATDSQLRTGGQGSVTGGRLEVACGQKSPKLNAKQAKPMANVPRLQNTS